jgi:hypothetical protein
MLLVTSNPFDPQMQVIAQYSCSHTSGFAAAINSWSSSAAVFATCRGYTRKEPFANLIGGLPWTPLVENWNGR